LENIIDTNIDSDSDSKAKRDQPAMEIRTNSDKAAPLIPTGEF
jgi:hypothetical protein